ncbi:uncharacterized protein K460DRAFT_39165 [Cucurbitaria berberidis CBS 394.84]|uniref:Uncharacterized protein n=1 Tax=Cucurbitaria berberidis CBS 394.84 TaxID=1168544 RepID=A0A9P4LDB2_9PLEO|nr:uncharacterized protein K460DRAFT_39165 [Cucurbitaria berberidis CBS 394.84]KAF1851676.1 hypothetical protein K460DRAFT_39165 [Cucurbitaria berberidis CBS 394.84]
MSPTFQEFMTAFPRRHRGRSVAFVEAAPETYIIPWELSSWQDGEFSESPSEYEVANAELLAKKALAAAVAEDEQEAYQHSIQSKTLQPTAKPSPPRYKPFPGAQMEIKRKPVAHRLPTPPPVYEVPLVAPTQIKRKPVPAPLLELPSVEGIKSAAPEVHDYTRRPALTRAETTFDDFLPRHKTNTWQEVDNADWQRRRARSVAGFATDTLQKAKYQVKKAVGRS